MLEMKNIERRFFYRKILKNTVGTGKAAGTKVFNRAAWQKRAVALVMTVALAAQLFSMMPDVTANNLPPADSLWKYPEIMVYNGELGKGTALADVTIPVSPYAMLEAHYKFKISEAELLEGIEVLLPDTSMLSRMFTASMFLMIR